MGYKEIELIKVIEKDVETLNLDLNLDDNKYYMNLIKNNLKLLKKQVKDRIDDFKLL